MLPGGCGRVLRLDDPGRPFAGLPSLEVASPDHAQRRHLGHADDMCGCIERDLAALSPFVIAVDRNVVVFSEAAHGLFDPSVAISLRLARSIKEAQSFDPASNAPTRAPAPSYLQAAANSAVQRHSIST